MAPNAAVKTSKPSTRTSKSGDIYSTPNKPYVALLNGPVLFTAPHGLEVMRGEGTEQRSHKQERYSTEISLKLALGIEKYLGFYGSCLVWNVKTAKRNDPKNLDPNYITKKQWEKSPWHNILKEFRSKYNQLPLFHVDIHGKLNRKKDRLLDVGTMRCKNYGKTKNKLDP
jgi:hypothetical protein